MADDISPFTPSAMNLIQFHPDLINRFAAKIDSLIDNWQDEDPDREEVLEPIVVNTPESFTYTDDIQELITHVGYDSEQCGYEK